MERIKNAVSSTKSKLKNTISKNKSKLAAGMLAGSILFTAGLFGCAKKQDNSNEDLKEQIASMQVENKSHEEQIALLKQEIASLKEIPVANGKRLEKLEELLTKLEQSGVSDEEFAASIDVLMAEIEKQSNAAMDKVIQEVEKNNTSPEVKEDLMEVLTKLKEEVVYGIRTDYQAVFLQAERIENAVNKQKENNEITEEQYNNIIGKVHEVQSSVIRVAVYNGSESLADKTGYAQVEVVGDDDVSKGKANIMFSNLKAAAKSVYYEKDAELGKFNEQPNSVLVYVDQKEMIEAEDGDVWRDDVGVSESPIPKFDSFVANQLVLDNDCEAIDYVYDAINGYKIVYNNYENAKPGTIKKRKLGEITIDFAKDGSLESVNNTYQTEEVKGKTLVELERYSLKYKFSAITQAEFESFCNSVKKELQTLIDNQEEKE